MKYQVKSPRNPKATCKTCPDRYLKKCDLCAERRERLYNSMVGYFENLPSKSQSLC